MTVGDRVKARREELGLTQTDLAQRMGYSTKTTICRLETSGDNVQRKTVERLAQALGVRPGFLLGWDDEADEQIKQYLADPDVRAFVLYAGGAIPVGSRKQYFDALRYTIEAMNAAGGKHG